MSENTLARTSHLTELEAAEDLEPQVDRLLTPRESWS